MEDFEWINLQGSWLRALGEAYMMLNDKFSKKEGFLKGHVIFTPPIIILLLAGTPTDDAASGLALLKENKWFQYSIKIAIEVREMEGYDFNHSALVDFAGKDGVVLTRPDQIEQYLKIIAIKYLL